MKTKGEYYKENRYYVHNTVALVIGIAFSIHIATKGFSLAAIIGLLICFGSLVVTYFLLTKAYKRYVKQEQAKEWAKTTATAMYTRYQETRTDMINTEEDD